MGKCKATMMRRELMIVQEDEAMIQEVRSIGEEVGA